MTWDANDEHWFTELAIKDATGEITNHEQEVLSLMRRLRSAWYDLDPAYKRMLKSIDKRQAEFSKKLDEVLKELKKGENDWI